MSVTDDGENIKDNNDVDNDDDELGNEDQGFTSNNSLNIFLCAQCLQKSSFLWKSTENVHPFYF